MTSAASPKPGSDSRRRFPDAQLTPRRRRPVHRVFVSEFFIGRFPVTQDETRASCARRPSGARYRELPLNRARRPRHGFSRARLGIRVGRRSAAGGARHAPGRAVTYETQLPTADGCLRRSVAWFRLRPRRSERAARAGVDGQRYPWGNDIDASRWKFSRRVGQQTPARTRPTGNVSTQRLRAVRRHPATPGSGSPTGTAPTITAWATARESARP